MGSAKRDDTLCQILGMVADAFELEPAHSLVNLSRFATKMVNDAMHAYTQRDGLEAQRVWSRDTELDAMYTALFRELLTYMLEKGSVTGRRISRKPCVI
jgi:phosphate uptake regulator